MEMNTDLEARTRDIAVRSISRWRRAAAAVLFALYLKKEGEKEQASSEAHADVEHAFEIEAGEEVRVTGATGDFGIGREERVALTQNDDVGGQEQYGRASPTHNIIFYLMTFLWEACQDSLIIFIAAVTSLMMGLVTKGTRFGYWEEGGSVVVVVTLIIIVKAICKYSQSQLYNVKEERRNMYSKEVLKVATSIGNFGVAVAFIAMMVLLLRWFTGHNLGGSPKFTRVKTKPRDVIEEVNQIIIIAFTIAVAAVPQGLPLAVTLTIVGATKRMVADNAIMSVVQAYAGGKKIDPSDNTTPHLSPNLSSLLTEGIAQNTEGSVVPESGAVDVSGSATEKAILRWGIKLGMNVKDIGSQSSVLKVVPFNSDRKRGAVALQLPDSQVRVHWKGVAEILLRSCTKCIDANDHSVAMNDDKLMFYKKAIADMAAGGLHCLAIAYRSYEFQNELQAQWELPEDDLVLLAIVGIRAFKWGQYVHANIIKFMELQLTVNVVALSTNFMAAVFCGHVPLNAVQLLWVNLLIVALVPLSLVTEPPPDEVTQGLFGESGQPPKRYINWTKLGFQSVCQIGGLLVINFLGKNLLKSYTSDHATKVKDTMIFNAFVVCQIFHQLEARKTDMLSKPKKWITSNYLFLGIVGTILTSQFIITEFLGKVFSTVALNQKEWQFSLTLGFVEILFAIILLVKYLTHRNQ